LAARRDCRRAPPPSLQTILAAVRGSSAAGRNLTTTPCPATLDWQRSGEGGDLIVGHLGHREGQRTGRRRRVRVPRLTYTRRPAGTARRPPGPRRQASPREDNEQHKQEHGDAGSCEGSVREGSRRGSQGCENEQDPPRAPAAPGRSAALTPATERMPPVRGPDQPSQMHETSQSPQRAPSLSGAQGPHVGRACPTSGSVMGGPLVLDVSERLELERRVLDVEVAGQAVLQLVEQPGELTVAEARFVDDDVRGEHRQS
jgi:hypothetical protein